MSKAKKIISMLLAVAMVLTLAPVSGLAALADDGYEYATPTLTPVTFTVDTTATTEVTRIAAGSGMFSLPDGTAEAPNTIVSATPSGIPSTGGPFSAIAYAGETPSYPKLVFKITGAVLDANPVITPSAADVVLGPVVKTTSGDTTTYTYEVSGNGATLAVGTDIVYDIAYVVNGVSYTAYAYSHIENIIIMNGAVSYRDKEKSGDRTRQSSVIQFQSKNMYTRMNGADLNVSTGYETDTSASSVSNRKLGYINYSAGTTTDGGAIKGLGSGTDLSGDTDAYGSTAPNGAINGTEQEALIKHVNTDNATTRNMCTHNDTNRGEPVIYLDATDTLDGLNFRMTMQNAEVSNFTSSTLNSIRFVQIGAANLADDCAISDEIYTQTGSPVSSAEISVLGTNFGSVTTIPANDYYSYAMAKFAGPGPAASATLNDNYTAFASWNTAASGNGDMQTTIGINLIFRRYDTRDLRALYNGILRGDGSTYTCVASIYAGVPVTFNRGVNPRAAMYNINSVDKDGNAYSAGKTDWTMFVDAMNTAGSLLARPDLNQTQIDNASLALYNAYHNLEGYSDEYYVEIHHCYAGTDTPITVNGTQLIQKVNNGNPVKSGQTISTAAATIDGYKVVGESVKKTDITGKLNADGTNKLIIKYSYEPVTYYINVAPNNPGYNNYMVSYGYEKDVDLTATNDDGSLVFDYGTRDHYTFLGWLNSNDSEVYDVLGANGTKSFKMPGNDVTLTGQWMITPLKVIGVPVTNKGVMFEGKQLGEDITFTDEAAQPKFNEPTKYVASVAADGTKTYQNGRYLNEGYLFGGYYESYDAATNTFSNPVSWPLTFNFGDSDKTIYIRWVDVNGTISFETNGGNTIDDITYSTTPAEITAPANPTKAGYDFAGWYSDESLADEYLIKGDDGTAWTAGKKKTQQTQTGFLAYAKWDAQYHTITFNMGNPTSDFDTTTAQMPIYGGYADQPFEDILPATPTRYGKVFAQWVIQGTNTVYNFDYYPKEDIVLVPVWTDTKYSAFISIGAYENLATGESTLVAPTTSGDNAIGSAQAGDVVTFRMTSLTNFYVGSSVFVFMYDKNFYDLVAEGTSAFVLNSDNEYVAGIEASAVGVTNDTTMSRVWPDSLESAGVRDDYNAMMVTIDPTVTTTNYNCEPMSDGKWLVEFKLKVKDTATEGDSGTVYMSNEWTRTADNIMGTMFYGWAETGDATVAETYNNVVTPNLDTATATIQIDPTPAVETTVTLNPYGGMWADGKTENVTYTGREATEIIGFTAPTREGYTIATDDAGNNIWYKLNADNTVDESVTWTEGYYATAETDGLTFVPAWEGLPFTVNYYVDDEGGELWDTEEVIFGEAITGPFYEVEKEGYEFVEWQDAEGNVYKVGESTVPLGGVDLYAKWEPGLVDFTVVIHYTNKQTNTDATTTRTLKAYTGSRVELVETAGTDENVTYVLWSSLPIVNRGYDFDSEDSRNETFIESVNGDGTSVLNVYYKAMDITLTFDATEGGKFTSTGEQTITSKGTFMDPFDINTIEKPVKDGYDFAGWDGSVTAYQQDKTFTAKWTVKQVTITYNANGGKFGTETESTVKVNHGTAIAAPATLPTRDGYTLKGWSLTADGEVLTDLGTATDYDNGHTLYAIWEKAPYKLTYTIGNADGSVSNEEETVVYEDTVTVREFPADIPGYTFVGWTYNGTTYAPGDTFAMPAGAVTLTGNFVADKYNAVFDATGGYFDGDTAATTKTVANVTFNTTAASPAKPERNGYAFLGWTLTSGSSTIDLAENAMFTMDAEGKTYYAVWKATIADYTIEYYYMDTEGNYPETTTDISEMSGQVEGIVTAPTPDKTGFTVDTGKSNLSGTVTPAPDNLVLKVYYAREKYHVYTIVDGVRSSAGEFFHGAAVTIADPPAKEGHSAVWSPAVESPMPIGGQEVTAVYTANTYPVIFYKEETDKTNPVYNNNIAYGTKLSNVEANFVAPTKDGYKLLGWAYEGTTNVLDLAAETVPVDGVKLVGIWEIQSYTVNFRTQGGVYEDGTNIKSPTFVYGTAVTAPEIPTRVGYTFTGWKDASTGAVFDVDDTLPAMIGAVVNYQAQWTLETYKVNFVIDETTISDDYAYGADIAVPDETQTVKTGWTFKYWTDAQGNEVTPPTVMGDIGDNGASVTYTAYFEIDSHNAIFVSEGTTVATVPYNYGAAVAKPADPSKTGWTFKGWKDAAGKLYGADEALPAMSTADVTYTAYFEIDSHNAIFVSEGTTVATVPYNYGAAVSKPEDPKKTGWTFKGWKDAADKLYGEDEALPAMGTADVTYTAYFEINSYVATFVAEGTPVETKSYNYGAAVNKPSTDPSKTGYTFNGWEAEDGTLYDAKTALPAMGAEDVTYTAKFTVNTYTVTWVFDNGTSDKEDSYQYGKAVTMASKPSKTGYTFSGWKYSVTGEIFADGATLPTMTDADVTYTAQWNIDSYTATFVVDNVEVETKSYEYGTAVAKPADPKKTGYTFVAWVGADGTEYDKDTALPAMDTSNVTYTAKFEINQYTIVFNAIDGKFADDKSTYTINQNYNTMATKPANPTQTGYTFKGWTTVENGTEADIVTVPATWYIEAENITYYAVWVINSYTVTYYADNEGTVAYTTTVEFGAAIQEPEAYDASFVDPTLEHYTFEGWSLTEVELGQYKEDVEASVIDFATAAPTVPENGIEIYPVFARVVVTLAIPEGSTAIVEIDDEAEGIVGYITGLETLLDEETLHSTYLAVEGDGRLVVTLTKYGVCGTGTKVEVIDNLTGLPVETYFLIIYGDVNGDAGIDATDASIVYGANNAKWANPNSESYDKCMVLAADIYDHDGIVTANDARAISDISLMVADVNQIDGIVEYYYI